MPIERGPLNSSEIPEAQPVAGVYNVTPPAPQDTQGCALQVDANGNLLVNVAVGGGGGSSTVKIEDTSGNALNSNGTGALNVAVVSGGGLNASVGLTGASAPTSATEIGIVVAGNLQNVSAANPMPVAIVSGELSTVTVVQPTGTNLHTVTDTGSTTAVTGNVTVVQPTGTNLHVVNDASSAVIGHVITDTGSVTNATLSAETTKVIGTVNQGTSPWVTSLASTTITGNVTVVQPTGTNLHVVVDSGSSLTAAVTGTLTNNNAAPAATNIGVLPAVANAANPTWTEGDQVLLSEDLSGHLRVVATGAAAKGGAVTGNPVLIAGSEGTHANTLFTDPNGVISIGYSENLADGLSNSNATGQLQGFNQSPFSLSVSNLVFNGTTWDRVRSTTIGNAVAATGIQANAAYGEYLSTAPAPTTGQYSALQTDNAGSLFVKPIRRSQTVSQATACTTTAATTVLAAQASGIFADISNLIITVLAVAVDVNFTVTLSDGTKSYVYNLNTGGVTTPSPGTQIVVNFNPPLPATTAATAWTLTMSVAETVNVNIVAVLQKAS